MDWAERYFSFLERRKLWVQAFLVVITIASLFFAAKLQLKTDFAELLPDRLDSVQALKEADHRIGGTGLLIVGIVSPDFNSNRAFIEDFAKKLDPLVGDSVRYYEYRYVDIRDFAEKYALHYLSIEQLAKLRTSLQNQVKERLDSSVGSFLGLDDDKPKQKPKSMVDMLNEDSSMDPSFKAFTSYRDAYLSAEDGKVLVMTLRPKGSSLSLGESQKLIDQVKEIVNGLKPKSFNKDMQIVYLGSVPQALEEFEAIRRDILDTSLMLTALILTVLFLFFWSFRMVALLLFNLLFAVAWTFGLTQLHIGYLNTQTAFLGSLVAGTGINYGIIFVSRYLELRHANVDVRAAVISAVRATMFPTLIASSTAAVSFGTLLMAENKGFSQFGFIGGVGIFLCWIAAYSMLPLWLYLLEVKFPSGRRQANPIATKLKPLGVRVGRFITDHAAGVAVVLVAFSVFGYFGYRRLAAEPLEYNFDNVRNKVTMAAESDSLRQRVYAAFPVSLTPSVAMADDEAGARSVCPSVREIQRSLPPEKNIIRSCSSFYELLPQTHPDAAEQKKLFTEIRDLLGQKAFKLSDDADMIARVRGNMSFTAPQSANLPEQLVRRFKERDGRTGLLAYVYPDSVKPLNDGRNLLNFTGSLAKLEHGPHKIAIAGDSFVLADLLRGIRKDGPRLTMIAFGGVTLIAILMSGGILNGLFMAFCLACATWWMLGVQGWFSMKYNFFNFIALPLTFGIGIDYPVNVFVRCRQEGFRDFGKIFAGSGMAVLLCSLTTIIGYYTLLGAASQALAGFGKLAIIGEFTCLTTALVLVPAMLKLMGLFSDGEVPAAEKTAE